MKITAENTNFASSFLCLFNEPQYEIFAVLIENLRIALVPEVNIGEHCGFLEEIIGHYLCFSRVSSILIKLSISFCFDDCFLIQEENLTLSFWDK